MEARYVVFTPGSLMDAIRAEGTAEEIAAWLFNWAGAAGVEYKILDREENRVMNPDYFKKKVGSKSGGHECLSEDDIRRIVREEMSNLLDAVCKKADVPSYLPTEKMEDALVSLVETVADEKANDAVNKHEDGFDHELK